MGNDWKAYKIGDLGKVVTGKTPSTKEPENFAGSYPFITIPDLGDRVYIDASERTLSDVGARKMKSLLLPPNSVMMSCIATIGKCGITTKPSFTNQQINSVVCKTNVVEPLFLYYTFTQLGYELESAGGGGSVYTNVSKSRFSEIIVSLPPLPEQRAIAGILGALDDKIELNRRMNRTLESMARAVFRQWFVESEEVGDWEVGRLGDNFNLTMGQSPPGETYNENREGMPFFQGRTDFGFRFPTNRVYCTAPTRFAEEGDTLVSVRAPVGNINMATEKSAIGRGVAAVRHKSGSRSYTYYAMHLLQEDFFRFEGEGTVFGSINRSDFENLKIAIPPVDKVKEFEMVCFPIDQMIENNEKESRTLANLRDTLLPKLMRGEVRVSVL